MVLPPLDDAVTESSEGFSINSEDPGGQRQRSPGPLAKTSLGPPVIQPLLSIWSGLPLPSVAPCPLHGGQSRCCRKLLRFPANRVAVRGQILGPVAQGQARALAFWRSSASWASVPSSGKKRQLIAPISGCGPVSCGCGFEMIVWWFGNLCPFIYGRQHWLLRAMSTDKL